MTGVPGTIGLIVNTRSRRNKERLGKLRAACHGIEGLLVHEIDGVADIPALLAGFARAGVTLVAVSGGDGTVQAAMTALVAQTDFAVRPPLALLAGGMTNVTAHHVGIPGKPEEGLRALIAKRAAGQPLNFLTHPVMGVRATEEAPAHYGMLVGGAAFYDGTMLARRRVHPVGFAQSAAAAVGGIAYIVRTLFGLTGHGHRLAMSADGTVTERGPCYLFLVSCLPGLILGLDPFWGEGLGPLRWTWVDDPPRHIALAAGPMLLGRPTGWMKRGGYRSGRAMRIAVESDAPLLFDGELVEPQPGKPVIIESGESLTFARL